MADQEYEQLKSQIQGLKKRLSESADDPQQTKEIEESLQRLEKRASSYSQRSSASASAAAAASSMFIMLSNNAFNLSNILFSLATASRLAGAVESLPERQTLGFTGFCAI